MSFVCRHSSSAVEHSIRNRAVVSSILTCGSRRIPSRAAAAGVIQLVECQLPKLDVAGSSPVARSFVHHDRNANAPAVRCRGVRVSFAAPRPHGDGGNPSMNAPELRRAAERRADQACTVVVTL